MYHIYVDLQFSPQCSSTASGSVIQFLGLIRGTHANLGVVNPGQARQGWRGTLIARCQQGKGWRTRASIEIAIINGGFCQPCPSN